MKQNIEGTCFDHHAGAEQDGIPSSVHQCAKSCCSRIMMSAASGWPWLFRRSHCLLKSTARFAAWNSLLAQWPVSASRPTFFESVCAVRVRFATSAWRGVRWAIRRLASCRAASRSPVIVPSSAERFDTSVPATAL